MYATLEYHHEGMVRVGVSLLLLAPLVFSNGNRRRTVAGVSVFRMA